MSRVQLALNVTDLDAAVAFYTKLFGAEPAKRRPGYANFAIADPPLKLVLIEETARGHGMSAPSTTSASRSRHRRGRCGTGRSAPTGLATAVESRRPVATRCRTRSGSTAPTVRRGRSTPSSLTRRRREWHRRRRDVLRSRAARVPAALASPARHVLLRRRGRRATAMVRTALWRSLLAEFLGSASSPPSSRLGHRRPEAVARQRRAGAVRERGGDGGGPLRPHPDLRAGVGRPLQPGRHPGRPGLRGISSPDAAAYIPSRSPVASAGRCWPTPCSPRPPLELDQAPRHRAAVPRRGRRHVRSPPGDLRSGPSGRAAVAPSAVGAYIGAAYFFTSSTSFANPAVTIGRTFTNTFAGIAPSSAPVSSSPSWSAALLAVGVIWVLYPDMHPR